MKLINKLGSVKNFDRSLEVLKQTQKYLQTEEGKKLPKAEVVGLASKKTEEFNEKRIQIYMNRLSKFFTYPRGQDADSIAKYERKINKFKTILLDKFVIKKEDIPKNAYYLNQEIAYDRGHGHVTLTVGQVWRQPPNQGLLN